MTNLPDQPVNSNLEEQKSDSPWWNRPVWGERSFLDDLKSKFDKETVPDNTIMLHRGSMMDLTIFAKTAAVVDNKKFLDPEFLSYVKIKYALDTGMNEYAEISESIKLFQVAIEAKNSYITLDQTELRYRSSKQQELYDFVQNKLTKEENKASFRNSVQEKLTEVLPHIKTEEGRKAMESYIEELDHLASHELGLKLLSLFKAYQLADYSILRIISDLVLSLADKDVKDLKTLIPLVMSKSQVFEKLGQIIGVPEKHNKPDTYALMTQYMVLGNKHFASYRKFEELLAVMRKWYKPFQAIAGIREQYPPKEFKIPTEFSEPIPGIEIYEKYRKALIDKRTGVVYINFYEHEEVSPDPAQEDDLEQAEPLTKPDSIEDN